MLKGSTVMLPFSFAIESDPAV